MVAGLSRTEPSANGDTHGGLKRRESRAISTIVLDQRGGTRKRHRNTPVPGYAGRPKSTQTVPATRPKAAAELSHSQEQCLLRRKLLGQRWVSDKVDSDEWGTRIELGRRLSPVVTLNGQTSASRRQYRNKKHLDGWSVNLSLGGTWTAAPIVRVNGTIGYTKEHTESERWRNSSRSLGTGVEVLLPRGFTASARASLAWKDYEGGWGIYTPDGVPRKDRTRNLSVSVFNRGFTLLGFSPKLTLFNDVRKTNAQLHDYRRNRGELQFVRQF